MTIDSEAEKTFISIVRSLFLNGFGLSYEVMEKALKIPEEKAIEFVVDAYEKFQSTETFKNQRKKINEKNNQDFKIKKNFENFLKKYEEKKYKKLMHAFCRFTYQKDITKWEDLQELLIFQKDLKLHICSNIKRINSYIKKDKIKNSPEIPKD